MLNYKKYIKEVQDFENHGFTSYDPNFRIRKRIIFHLLDTGVFWGNVDPDQDNDYTGNIYRQLGKT